MVAIALVTAAAEGARADGGDDQQRALALFEQGRKLAREEHCADAIAPLRESLRYSEGVGVLLNLGHCYEVLGKHASAQRAFVRAEQIAAARGDTRREEAAQRAMVVGKTVSTLTVVVPTAVRQPGVEVRVDGDALPLERWDVPLPVDPGTHAVEVVAPGRPKQKDAIVVRAGADRVTWTAPVLPVVAPAPAPPPRASSDAPPASSRPSSTQRTLGYVLGGTGLAGLAAGSIFGVLSIRTHASLVGQCPAYPRCSSQDQVQLDQLNGRAQTTGNVSTIAFVAGSALLVGGAALVFTAPRAGR